MFFGGPSGHGRLTGCTYELNRATRPLGPLSMALLEVLRGRSVTSARNVAIALMSAFLAYRC
jgi:hypothetical protein